MVCLGVWQLRRLLCYTGAIVLAWYDCHAMRYIAAQWYAMQYWAVLGQAMACYAGLCDAMV